MMPNKIDWQTLQAEILERTSCQIFSNGKFIHDPIIILTGSEPLDQEKRYFHQISAEP